METAILPGKYFDEFIAGEEFLTPSRTITETDIVNFAALSGDYHPLHTDEEYAKKTVHQGRIAHGALISAIATGLMGRLGLFDGTAIANMGQEWRFKRAVKIGDTITIKVKILEKRETAKKETGLIIREISILNQRGEEVGEGKATMVGKRGT